MSEQRRRRSLRSFYFGSAVADVEGGWTDEAVEAVISRAYRDVNRTIHGMGKFAGADTLRTSLSQSLVEWVKALDQVNSQDHFDEAHTAWCVGAIEKFERCADGSGLELRYGQAQKWINMTLKYLAVLGHPGVTRVYHLLHVPLDRIVYSRAQELGIGVPSISGWTWSRLDEGEYREYQVSLRELLQEKLGYLAVLDWEADVWS